MLYMAAVAKTAVTSKFDLSWRPLSDQRACMANTRDAPTDLMSEVCMEQCTASLRICTLLHDQPKSDSQFCYEPHGEYPLREFNLLDQSREFKNACELVSCTRIRLVRMFPLRCLPLIFLQDVFHLFFLQAQKQFRYAARFASTLTATEQLRTQVTRAAYFHLATFAPYG